MATTAGDFITKLATMAGVSLSDPDLVSILSSSEFASYKLPDAIASKINAGILTPDSARNNEALRKHYHAEILNGLDSNIESMMEKLGIDSDLAEQIKQEKKTTDKYGKLIEQLNELHAKKAKATTSADKKELTDEIAKLNSKVLELSENLKKAPVERDQFWSERLKGKAVQNMLTAFKYAGEQNIPKEVLIETASVLLNRKLNENKIRLEYNPDNDNISLKTESGMDFYKDNTPVSFKDFASSVLAESKLLEIPAPAAASNPNPTHQQPQKTVVAASGKAVDTSKWDAAMAEIEADTKK